MDLRLSFLIPHQSGTVLARQHSALAARLLQQRSGEQTQKATAETGTSLRKQSKRLPEPSPERLVRRDHYHSGASMEIAMAAEIGPDLR
jgi:hypothetical protein